MKKSIIKIIVLLALLITSACSEDSIVENTINTNGNDYYLQEISITGKDFQFEDETRSSVSITENGASFTWDVDDVIGIFPNKGDQVSFAMDNGVGTQTATFSGGGWALKSSATYAAYYPHVYENRDMTKIPVSYVGQTQNGNNNTDHIGAYDFMASSVSTPSNGAVAFDMQHLGCLLRIQFNAPEDMTLKKVQLVTLGEDFTAEGYIDLSQLTPKITASKTTNFVSINSTMTVKKSNTVTLYVMIAPINLTGKDLDLIVEDYTGFVYRSSVICNVKKFDAGKIYALSANLVLQRNATLIEGETFNKTIKNLCSNGTVKSITFKCSTKTVPSSYEIVSTTGSDYPIYASASYGNVTISTEADKLILNENSYAMFSDLNITSIDLSNLITDNVTNMQGMFAGCSELTTLDLSHFNTRKVTNMTFLFNRCTALTNINIEGWETDRVTSMVAMFNMCTSLQTLDLRHFNTSNVTEMYHMFCSCSSLISLNVGAFDTRNVTNMSNMFQGCTALKSLILNNFDTHKVTNMRYMFSGCESLTLLDLNGFETENVTDMSGMFYDTFDTFTYNSEMRELDLGEYFIITSNTNTADISNFANIKITCLPSVKPYLQAKSTETIWINAITGEIFK